MNEPGPPRPPGPSYPPNPYGAITDVPGIEVGHADRRGDGWLTGVTVVLPPAEPDRTVAAVDVRGGAPGTQETDALAPGRLVERAHAVVLTGGSAFGLASAVGVRHWCAERGRGFAVRPDVHVPIVPTAVLFDLGYGGDITARPDAELGYAAAAGARPGPVATGTVGAGTGAMLGGAPFGSITIGRTTIGGDGQRIGSIGANEADPPAPLRVKGAVGTASVRLSGGVVVGALVAANAAGSPYDPATGALYAAQYVPDAALRPAIPGHPAPDSGPIDPAGPAAGSGQPGSVNTTLAVIATNAKLDRPQTMRMAAAGHDGLARAIRPIHTLVDGDTVIGLATGDVDASECAPTTWPGAADIGGVVAVQAAAAEAVTLALLDAVLSATGVRTPAVEVPSYLELFPSARPEALGG